MTYRSKMDTWLIVVIGVSSLITVTAGAMFILRGGLLDVLLGLLTVGIMVGAMLYIVPLGYDIEDDVLVIRVGLRQWRILIRDIVDVQPTRDPTASPALSLDRLRIKYKEDGRTSTILISPDERDSFLDELARRRGVCASGDISVAAKS